MPKSPERADGLERSTNLPAHRPTLIGRDGALAAVRRLLLEADQGLVTLVGTGGCGKTQLALAVADSLLDEFPDGVFVSDLAPLSDPELVAGVVAASTGIAERSGQPIRDILLERLRAQSMLLVLDNCEHLVEASAALADDLVGACPRLRILSTSREPLRISRERVWRVQPLPVPDLSVESVPAELAQNAAIQLFVERARALEPAFALNSQNSQVIAVICAKLAGLPLAIELAAARVRTLTPNEILARLDDAFELLVGGSRTAPSRHQTMRAALDWSYRLLGTKAQSAFERLAVFAGGFDVAAAEAVWFDERDAPADTLATLTELVDRSLAVAEPLATGMRYRLLEPVRQYAHDRLKAHGAWERSRKLHADYFLALAERAEQGLQSADRDIWLARLKLDHDNLRAALRGCLDAGDAETAVRTAAALRHFWRQTGYRSEGRHWLEDALDLGADISPAPFAKGAQAAALLAYSVGDYRLARTRFEQAVVQYRTLGDGPGLGATLTWFGRMAARTAANAQDFQHATAMLEEAISLNDASNSAWYAGVARLSLGISRWEQGQLDLAPLTLDEGQRMATQMGEHHLHSHIACMRGPVARDLGDMPRARQLIESSLAEARAIECLDGTAEALYFLAGLSRLEGDPQRGISRAAESFLLQHGMSNDAELPNCLELLAGLACAQGQPERGTTLFAAAATLREHLNLPLPPILRSGNLRDLTDARMALGSRRYATAWNHGLRMSMDELVQYARQMAAASAPKQSPSNPLSPREREIVALLATGDSNRRIAQQLIISERTVDGHVAHILDKLGLQTRAQAAVWAVQHQPHPQ